MKKSITTLVRCIVPVLLFLLLFPAGSFAQAQTSSSFEFTSTPMLTAERDIHPVEYKAVRVDLNSLETSLSTAPLIRTGRLDGAPEITLPLPDGTFQRFNVAEAPIMEDGLAERYPNIRTYRVSGIDNRSAYGRISVTPAGFHAMITSTAGTYYIDPFNAQQRDHVMVYKRKHLVQNFQRRLGVEQHEPVVADPQVERESLEAAMSAEPLFSGTVHRSYRLAMAATAQYTAFHSQPARCADPTEPVECAMAAIVVAMNRVNGIYERDVAVTMNLIENNDILISQDPGDYSNNSGFSMLNQNQIRIDNLIGSENYDIGHVFSTGGGGVAQLGAVCNNSGKARGVTGLPQPINDPFYVDYVSHEIGHQYAATHTFNASGNCGNQRSGQTAFEPGSGSTIMAYAGLCGGQNIQNFSDDYFHLGSINQIVNFINNPNSGGSCSVDTPTDNTPPVVDGGVEGLTLPISTPFTLEGSGTDADGDDLVFNWEQYDTGPAGPPNQPVGNAPLFRSFSPVEEPVRTFPRWINILNGTQSIGERLPDYNRNMRFRLTARDNVPINGGIGFDQVQFAVTSSAGPFLVPVPGNGTQWQTGNEVLIAWDVANTNVAPVNAETVTIYLSANAGQDFDIILAENVPNNGVAFVELPAGLTSNTARIKIKADDHIFFNVSPANFSISASPELPVAIIEEDLIELTVSTQELAEGSFSVSVQNSAAFNYVISLSDENLPDGTIALDTERIVFENESGSVPGNSTRSIEFTVDAEDMEGGFYATRVVLSSDNGVDEISGVILLDVRVASTVSQLLTTPEGWRLTTAPVENETVSGVLSSFTTQGFPGADNEGEEFNPSVYYYAVNGIQPVPDIEHELTGGEGFLAYLFADDMPAFLNAFGFSNRSPFEMELNNQLIIGAPGASGPPQQGWNMKGNPFNQRINLANLRDEDIENTSRAFQIWNNRLNEGQGGYLAFNGYDFYPEDVPDTRAFRGEVDRFQGFWARALSNNASITLDEEVLTNSDFAPNPEDQLFAAYYTLELTAGDFTAYNVVMFSEEGTTGVDPYDADQLIALSNEYAYFYSASARPRVIESLPLNESAAVVEVPMNAEATFDGEFTIRLARISGPAQNFGGLNFTDQVTGETVSLEEGQSFTFNYEAPTDEEPADDDPVRVITNLPGHALPDDSPRFLATFTLNTPVNLNNEELNVPNQVQLRQNYPNPFNPTTNITFGLPEAADVTLEVYNVAGQRVATLVNNSTMGSGYHTVNFDASRLASGVYLYRIKAAGQVRTEKMTLIK